MLEPHTANPPALAHSHSYNILSQLAHLTLLTLALLRIALRPARLVVRADVFRARVQQLRVWLAGRPESVIGVVAHWGLLKELTGGWV